VKCKSTAVSEHDTGFCGLPAVVLMQMPGAWQVKPSCWAVWKTYQSGLITAHAKALPAQAGAKQGFTAKAFKQADRKVLHLSTASICNFLCICTKYAG